MPLTRRAVLPALASLAGLLPGEGTCAAEPVVTPASAPAYTLDHTEVLEVTAAALGRRYDLYVSLPVDYARTSRRYPVVAVTDAPYAFPLIRAIAGRVSRHGAGLEPFILLGLGYAQGDSGAVSRNRDYTPTDRRLDGHFEPGAYGQGAAYLDHLAREALPLVDSRYRTQAGRRVYVGHSYGALLGLQALLDSPGLFGHYVLGSPSLWFDQGHAFRALRRHARGHGDIQARVRLYVGGLERPSPGHPKDEDMVAQMKAYVEQLRARRWPGLDVQGQVLEGEDHATVFPRLVTRGLAWALPVSR